MKAILLIWCLLFLCIHTKAQERIDTDRPDQTESAATVPLHFFQAELGFNREAYKEDLVRWVHPTGLYKYGVHRRAEIRVEAAFLTEKQEDAPNNSGFEAVEVGAKVALWEERKLLPKTSVIAQVGIPFLAGTAFRAPGLSPIVRLTCQHTLTSYCALGYNVGLSWDGERDAPTYFYTLSPGFNIGKRWYGYVEAFGFMRSDDLPEHNLAGGIAYYVTNDLKIDASGGVGVGSSTLQHYFAIGGSFRFRVVKSSHK